MNRKRNIYNIRVASFLLLMAAQNNLAQPDFVNSNIAMNDSDIVAVVCNSSIAQGGNVYLTSLDRFNKYSFPPIIVNGKLSGYAQNADVGIDNNGNISVVWEQWSGDRGAVYRARYTHGGSIIDSAQCITDSLINSGSVKISVTPKGKAVAVWLDYRFNHPSIFAQRFDDNGNKIGANFLISNGLSLPQYPYCKANDSIIAFVWQDVEKRIFHVYTSSCSWNTVCSPAFVVDEGNGMASSSNPEILLLKNGKEAIVWKDYRTGEANVYLQIIDKQKSKHRLSNKMINDDNTARWQRLPRISGSPSGTFICVWEDYRNNNENQIGDIYGQLFSSEAKLKGNNFKIHKTKEPTVQEFPSVAMNAKENVVVAWTDGRSSTLKIYLQKFNARSDWMLEEVVVFPFAD